ncbi:redoxin domain-containing protein [Pedococcus sp. 5OH_020]|uniref:redoxin domain-containing protein n=1 Tax=Pedococcus sp. 5OH_020 TaxID=2989814 RepID=UPI0022E9E725|nr:redoxin domain-containing protein [Pedococcus sp. 5OH_020]
MLSSGSPFPRLSLSTTTGEEPVLPSAAPGSYAVILVHRGSWCRQCVGPLRSFASRSDTLVAENITTVASPADSRSTARKTVEELDIPLAAGCEACVPQVAEALECYTDPEMRFFHSTDLVLDPKGHILRAVYSPGAVGRLGPHRRDGFVNSRRSSTARPTS